MTSRRRILNSTPLLLLATWAFAFVLGANAEGQEAAMAEADKGESVALRGEVVDINAELKKSHTIDISADAEPLYGFKTSGGKIYTLLKTGRSLALFMDQRLHGRELIVKGRVFGDTRIFEATFIQSVNEGVLHDLYYYCDICAIKSLTPEICACCREPVRLVEEPVKQN